MEEQQPLWMPKGSVRALLTIGLLLAVVAITGFLVVENSSSEASLLLLGILGGGLSGATGYYFASRKDS
ncbi:hypothetical protein LCGC14_2534320 [marine sediment metagenome]|uniref:Uncharacterized protein n=1 Tax=marine sediment metagenome TaxID=412755 RepID=A0A0F9DKN6_9ZZZZ